MSKMNLDNVTVTSEMQLDFPAEIIWPQLCPTREYDWIEVWDCELIHSESGYNELGCVFRTNFPIEGGWETWMTCRFEPMKRIEFVRTNEIRVIHFIIDLAPTATGTKLTWTQHVVALNETGNHYVKDKPEAFASQMEMLGKMLAHYLKTGKMMQGETLGLMEKIKAHVHSRKTR